MRIQDANYSRSTVQDKLSMWGRLYIDENGAMAGWLVDSWSERGVFPPFQPRMHWMSKEDDKFYRVYFKFDFRMMELLGEDTEVEPERAAFIRSALTGWEKDYVRDQ